MPLYKNVTQRVRKLPSCSKFLFCLDGFRVPSVTDAEQVNHFCEGHWA